MYKKGQKVYRVIGATGRDAVAWIKEFEVVSWGAKEGRSAGVSFSGKGIGVQVHSHDRGRQLSGPYEADPRGALR